MNMFPPCSTTSCALLSYSAYGKNNGLTFADVQSAAISSVFRGVEPLPAREDEEKHIDKHQEWVAERWLLDSHCIPIAAPVWSSSGGSRSFSTVERAPAWRTSDGDGKAGSLGPGTRKCII